MITENWADYVNRVLQGASVEDAAAATGIHISTLYRWMREGGRQKSPDQVIKFARALGLSPVEAMIAAGYLEPDEVGGVIKVLRSVHELPDAELLGEMARRLARD